MKLKNYCRRTFVTSLVLGLCLATLEAQGFENMATGVESRFAAALAQSGQLAAQASALQTRRSDNPVRGPEGGWWETGYVIGRPVKISSKGIIKTWETDLLVGEFPNDASFVGTLFNMSIESSHENLVSRFQGLDSTKNYIFKYKRPYLLNPEIEDTHYHITDIQEALTPDQLPKSGLPQEVETNRGRRGWYSTGDRGGRIISVERWGKIGKVCTFELALGGIQAGSGGENGSPTNISAEGFAIYSEEGCSFVEQLLRYQVKVNVSYTQDVIEFWDYYERIAHKVSVLATSTLPAPGNTPNISAPEKQDPYEAFRNKLLSDPEFLRKLREKLQNQP